MANPVGELVGKVVGRVTGACVAGAAVGEVGPGLLEVAATNVIVAGGLAGVGAAGDQFIGHDNPAPDPRDK